MKTRTIKTLSAAVIVTLIGANASGAHAAPKTVVAKAPATSGAKAPRITVADFLKTHPDRDVAFDAKDKKFYSVAYAKAHGMRDKGGDTLTVHRLSTLPPDAAMSRAMHGKM